MRYSGTVVEQHLGTRLYQQASSARPRIVNAKTTPQKMREVALNYAAVQPSKFRRTRSNLGGTADAHYVGLDLWNLREQVRDMDRNDHLVGQLVDRACQNILGTGMSPDPNTGDVGLDDEIRARWQDWSEDPLQCDTAHRHPFCVLEYLALRHTMVDGDVFSLLADDGSVQLVEGDRVESPLSMLDNLIHGVEMDGIGRPLRYWFTRDDDDPSRRRELRRLVIPSSPDQYMKVPALDQDGAPVVLHVYDPKRYSQSRGVTALKAVVDVLGMIEDVNFAELVKRQVASCIAAFIRRTDTGDLKFGSRTTETGNDGGTTHFEELQPGLVARLGPGEDVTGYSPAVVSSDFEQQLHYLIRIVGANLGVPLSIGLLDTSDTTFHGYRGELDQARLGFRWVQKWFRIKWHSPIYRWKVRSWFPERAGDPLLTRHKFTPPGWPYIEPLKDAQADELRIKAGLDSPRGVLAARGLDWGDVCRQRIEDHALLFAKAQEAAAALPEPTDWRELLSGVSVQPVAPMAEDQPDPVPGEGDPE